MSVGLIGEPHQSGLWHSASAQSVQPLTEVETGNSQLDEVYHSWSEPSFSLSAGTVFHAIETVSFNPEPRNPLAARVYFKVSAQPGNFNFKSPTENLSALKMSAVFARSEAGGHCRSVA